MQNHVTLNQVADEAMRDKGFYPDFPIDVVNQVHSLESAETPKDPRDLRDLLWVSIDNDDSEDLDQLTYAEDSRIYVAVADVAGLVKKGSPIDNYAAHNTTSIYTPTKVFPMLPLELSTDLTSLNENQDRSALVVEMEVKNDGKIELIDIYSALVRNKAKLAYDSVAAFLDKQGPIPKQIEGLEEQLKLQDAVTRRMKHARFEQGALHFSTIELEPVFAEGKVVGLKERVFNRAHALIENFMVAANMSVSRHFTKQKIPMIQRVVRVPKRWDRIVELAKTYNFRLPPEPDGKALRDFLLKQQRENPDEFADLSLAVIKLIGRGEYVLASPGDKEIGHFNLGVLEYAHTTAPNRRFPDLIMQRMLKNSLMDKPLAYHAEELAQLAAHCTEQEDAATKVERRVRKSAAAMVLAPHIGQIYSAMVTGASDEGTWVRLYDPPIEGKLIEGFKHLDVGDKLNVRLVNVDIGKGFIDFVKV